MADEKSAMKRRQEQLKRWEDSDTSRELGVPKDKSRKVKFHDGCVFLAACSSGDTDEVNKLLEKGADINTANIDGLTALHQACIDDNLDMVEFLVQNDADVDVCDNEGWTPLHATASCGFTEIARYLIQKGANIAAVNNDGDLPIDICEDEEMEKLLQDEMDSQGVDAESARREEEDKMLEDANQWLNSRIIKEQKHTKTGASALHVAAAKGYVKVMNVLLQANVDINAMDNDGWTPLHAAAHWGQEEACKILVEHMCDMEAKNSAGQTAFDVADSLMVKVLDDLKKKQIQMRDKDDLGKEIIQTKGPLNKRRSSVTRMSIDQKQNVILKTVEQERAALEAAHIIEKKEEEKKTSSSSASDEESSDSDAFETERENEINKKNLEQSQHREKERPASLSTLVEFRKPEMPKIDEVSETEKPALPVVNSVKNEEKSVPEETKVDEDTSKISPKEPLRKSISAPSSIPISAEEESSTARTNNTIVTSRLDVPSWRAGLKKMGSTSQVHETMNQNNSEADKSLPRSASSPRLAHALDNRIENDWLASRRPQSSSAALPSSTITSIQDNKTTTSTDKYSSTYGRSYHSPYRNLTSSSHSSYPSYHSAYVPYYRRQQDQLERKEREREEEKKERDKETISLSARTTTLPTTPSTSASAITSPASTITATTTSVTTVTSTTMSTTITTPTTTTVFRRSYEPPKRDEETETQRKARAKKARETRRSTQGVTLEDIEKAEEVLRSTDAHKDRNRTTEKETEKDSVRDTSRSVTDSARDTQTESTTDRTSANQSSRDPSSEDSSVYYRRRPWSERRDDETKGSFRRSRENRDGTSSLHTSDVTSSYTPRSQRNALSTSDINNTSSLTTSSTGLSRTPSLRSSIRNGEVDTSREDESKRETKDESRKEEKKADQDSQDTTDGKRESSAIRAKRARRERRSTGIVQYSPEAEDDEKGKENKPEETTKDTKKDTDTSGVSSRYVPRYGSSSDVPSSSDRYSSRDRPSSYSEYSRSTPALDTEYKKLYEEEKSENDRLRKELEQVKKELIDAKSDLDRLVKRNESARSADTNDKREKRALERKLSELEEELKQMEKLKADNAKLKEENRALTRVVSKLSK